MTTTRRFFMTLITFPGFMLGKVGRLFGQAANPAKPTTDFVLFSTDPFTGEIKVSSPPDWKPRLEDWRDMYFEKARIVGEQRLEIDRLKSELHTARQELDQIKKAQKDQVREPKATHTPPGPPYTPGRLKPGDIIGPALYTAPRYPRSPTSRNKS